MRVQARYNGTVGPWITVEFDNGIVSDTSTPTATHTPNGYADNYGHSNGHTNGHTYSHTNGHEHTDSQRVYIRGIGNRVGSVHHQQPDRRIRAFDS